MIIDVACPLCGAELDVSVEFGPSLQVVGGRARARVRIAGIVCTDCGADFSDA